MVIIVDERDHSYDEVVALAAKVERLERALKPFADEATEYNEEYREDWKHAPDNELIGSQFVGLTFGDFREAARALSQEPPDA